jgi:hypothetical protein
VLTPFLGELGSASLAKAVVAAAGRPGRAVVFGDAAAARALAQRGFKVIFATSSRRVRPRIDYTLVHAMADDAPLRDGCADVIVYSGRGSALRGAAEDASRAGEEVRGWVRPLAVGGRLVLVDRIDGGLLGARPVPTRDDLCAALLAGRLECIAQLSPRGGTVVTHGIVPTWARV